MEEPVEFASRAYWIVLALLLFARGMDFLSTWIATPNLLLEANPIAKKLGWRWGIPVNVLICLALALWPLPAIVVATTSVLVAARNFQSAWLMRSFGEVRYTCLVAEQMARTSLALYLFCVMSQAVLTAAVGAALMWFSEDQEVPLAIGLGIVAYAVAVAIYTLLSLRRGRSAPEA